VELKMYCCCFSHIAFWPLCWTNLQMGKTFRAMERGKTEI